AAFGPDNQPVSKEHVEGCCVHQVGIVLSEIAMCSEDRSIPGRDKIFSS
ncbi:MAG: hypothetical protein JWR18_263, partial [Segetibacter sp.]|nr:hypothetical protein [Segetibacter sp.]